MKSLKLIDASSKGTVTYHLLIDPSMTNLNGVMHGGAAGVIFDMATMSALGPIARKGFWDFLGGVTRVLNLSFLRAIPVGWWPFSRMKRGNKTDMKIGTTVMIHSEVVQVGKTMAMICGTMSSLDGKTIYATCEQHKVAVPTQPKHLEFRIGWDDLWDKESVMSTNGEKSKL
jgi:acyl-coenzyme A thioesterase 13